MRSTHAGDADVRRQRQLHEDAVNGRIVVQRVDARQQLALRSTLAGSSISSERMPTSLQPAILLRT